MRILSSVRSVVASARCFLAELQTENTFGNRAGVEQECVGRAFRSQPGRSEQRGPNSCTIGQEDGRCVGLARSLIRTGGPPSLFLRRLCIVSQTEVAPGCTSREVNHVAGIGYRQVVVKRDIYGDRFQQDLRRVLIRGLLLSAFSYHHDVYKRDRDSVSERCLYDK